MQYLCTFNTLPHISFMNYFAPKGEWTHFRRQNGEYILYYLVDGAMHLREGEKEYSLKAGDVFLLQPGLVHEGTKPAGCAYYFVHFSNICILPFERETVPLEGDADFFQTYEEGGEGQYDMEHCVLPKLLHIRSEKARAQIAKCFDEAIERARSGAQNYRVFWACKFLEILMAISQNSADAAFEAVDSELPARTMRRMEELTAYLNEQYMEKITGKQLEDMLGMNFDYLNRTFRKLTGKTIFQYLGRVRINRAKELLVTTDMKLAEIAMETGFSDEFYLSRQFKKYTGVSPALYSKGRMKGG